jgi:hypothetical protein
MTGIIRAIVDCVKVDANLGTVRVGGVEWVGLLPVQAINAGIRLPKVAEQVVEASIFQHEDNHILDGCCAGQYQADKCQGKNFVHAFARYFLLKQNVCHDLQPRFFF